MKKFLLVAVLSIAASFGLSAQQTDTYFPYPIVPDSISSLQGRMDYLIAHFWDFCDFKKAFNNKQRMAETFRDYLHLMPHGTKRNVHKAIAVLLKGLEKQPNDVLFLGQKAKEYILSDTSALYYSEEIYLPFARAVTGNKKISEADKAPFLKDVKILSFTQKGMPMPEFAYTTREGLKKTYQPDSSEVTILFFADSQNMDCTIARSRLYSDIKASGFVNDGVMRVIVINPLSDDPGWTDAAQRYPAEWEVGSAPGLDSMFDIKFIPSFYVVDDNNVIQIKNIDINTLLAIIMKL